MINEIMQAYKLSKMIHFNDSSALLLYILHICAYILYTYNCINIKLLGPSPLSLSTDLNF